MVCILRDFNVIGFFFSLMHSTTLGKGREEQMKGIFFFSTKLQLVSAVALFNTNNLAFFYYFNVVIFLNKKILHV